MSAPMPHGFPDFDAQADFDAIKSALPMFQDSSWHNDACPSLSASIDGVGAVRVWIDYRAPELREHEGLRQFAVAYEPAESESFDIGATDCVGECVKMALETFAAKLSPKFPNS